MEFQGKNSKHDALDALLRRYLLEHDRSGLLEGSGEQVLAGPPKVTPTAAREAEMIERLQHSFPGSATTAPSPSMGLLRPMLIATGAIAVLTTAVLLWFDPLGATHRQLKPYNDTPSSMLGGPTDAEVPNASAPLVIGDQQYTSLQQGNGANPTNLVDASGTGDRGTHPPRSWGKTPKHTTVRANSDPLSVSPSLFRPLTTDGDNGFPLRQEPLDPFPLRSLYAQTNTTSRYYHLEPDKDHLIRGRKGTLLHIPKGAFVDAASGEAVEELVQVELKEVYDRSDYLKTNLPTMFNGRQLVSGGVVYVDATAAGRRLALAKGKDIYVEFAHNPKVDMADMGISAGEFNERGEMNWLPSNANLGRMIPLDLDALYFDEFYCDCKGEKLWNNLLWAISDPSFSTTWIATREFRQRLHALSQMNYYSQGLIAYRDNVDKDLWKVDMIVAGMLRDLLPQGLAKEEEVAVFEAFAREQLTQVEAFDDRGVNLSKPDARRQLLYRRVDREETERLLRIDRLRREYAEEIASRLVVANTGMGTYVVKVKPGQSKGSPRKTLKGFLVQHLGWIHLSRPVDRDFVNAKSQDLKVRLTGEVPYESTRAFLVYTDMVSLVPGSLTTGQLFRFRDVPRYAEAKILAIGFKEGMPYLGIESLPKDGSGQILTIAMRRMQIDDYMGALAALD